jgi:hypothetical protein
MAKKQGGADANINTTNTFIKGLNKDSDPSFVQEGMWTHARNASNNTAEGDLGTLSNESSNYLCAEAGKTLQGQEKVIVGAVHLFSDKWIIFTAAYQAGNNVKSSDSEIGLFEEDLCRYRTIVQDQCLKFSKLHLITGASREAADCSWQVYWADGLNPDRYLNVGDPQTWPGNNYTYIGTSNPNYYTDGTNEILWPGVEWVEECTDTACIECTDTNVLNCDKIRLARLMQPPCVTVERGKSGGQLNNGSYIVVVAYSIKGQRVTDWFSPSPVQPIWSQNEPSGALEVKVEADSEAFEEFILCVVEISNQQTIAKQFGIYSTRTTDIYIDFIDPTLTAVPINTLPLQTPIYEKSDQIEEVNNYLLRIGPTSKFDFNYQPLANLIQTNWVVAEYPEDYYVKGGNKTSYLRDEVYAFFIRWVYDTGDKSASYHIPGRAPKDFNVPGIGNTYETSPLSNINSINDSPTDPERVFEIYNTASVNSLVQTTLDDGGVIIGRGDMAYWESTEIYPDNRPDIWNSSEYCWTGVPFPDTDYDLCGLPIRHHKMPDQTVHPAIAHFNDSGNGVNIRMLGVEFSNIIYPKDQDGNDIPNIIGYEILRGSREGNKSILAKGMLNNLRPYNIKGNAASQNKRGLYPNHPFNTIAPVNPNNSNNGSLNPSLADIKDPYFLTTDDNGNPINYTIDFMPKNINTFHSPDINFRDLYLSATELKTYGYLAGISNQSFVEPEGHPKHKLLSDEAIFFMFVGGLIEWALALKGEVIINEPPTTTGSIFANSPTGPGLGATAAGLFAGPLGTYNTFIKNYYESGLFLADVPLPGNPILNSAEGIMAAAEAAAALAGLITPQKITNTNKLGKAQYAGPLGFGQALLYFAEGADLTLKLIRLFVPYRQFALQMLAHGFYNLFSQTSLAQRFRFKIEESFNLKNTIQQLKPYNIGANSITYSVNNLSRSKSTILRTVNAQDQNDGPDYIVNPSPSPYANNQDIYYDNSLVTIGTARDNNLVTPGSPVQTNFNEEEKLNAFNARIASHYGAMKVRFRNQYGQMNGIKQIPITSCEQKFEYSALPTQGPVCSNPGPDQRILPATEPLFNGDTYITRYTEKNTMFMFYDWLYGQPDGTEFNYFFRQMIPQPRFWANTEEFDISDMITNFNLNPNNPPSGGGFLPNSYHQLDTDNYNYFFDQQGALEGFIGIRNAYFYLATSAVRDFFVESEILTDFRETGETQYERAYDRYLDTDLNSMFKMDPLQIKRGNYYAYDFSLSVTKLFTQYYSQGNLQSRYYDPNVAELCYTYLPDRILYSLPQQDESLKDSWFVYLPNNYKEFKDKISGVKNFAKTGIFITFENSSPLVFQGVDQLQTDAGTKITIGDGGLFAQTPQAIAIADKPFEYGSSQDRFSVISTPAGFYYISQNQGKIFAYSGKLEEISQRGMKWWFTLFLPYKLTEDFPDYPFTDNPVAGVGCQSTYDNRNSMLYFSKKDYKLKEEYKDRVTFNADENAFYLDEKSKFLLGDPILFEDASWTISYDPKNKFFISFHDWHPDLFMPGKNSFMTTKLNGIWRHNSLCDNFCNFYGTDYPFEVELPMITGQTVKTVRSMEYMLECYRRQQGNCVDQFHVLDYNFDQAVLYNSEQVSGYLNLNTYPKNNVALSLQYPQINLNSIDILYSKEENKYRFNQFWDITKDRGEFPVGSDYPPTGPVTPGTTTLAGPYEQQPIWFTEPNGYVASLNQQNLNYDKSQLQRKKFRHYLNFLRLTRKVSGNTNMILKIVNSKNTYSPR